MSPRDEVLKGKTYTVKTRECGNCKVTINKQNGTVRELALTMGKRYYCIQVHKDTINKLAGLALKHGADPKKIANCLNHRDCNLSDKDNPSCLQGAADKLFNELNHQ